MIEVRGEDNLKELQDKIMRWSMVAPQEVKKVLQKGAEMVRREVQEKHFRLPKMPRGVGDPTDAWLGTSKAWRLRNSINYKVAVKPGEFSAIIGTNVPHGRKHELGLEGMPERPFLRPSLAKKRPEVFQMIREAYFKSYGK